MEFSSLYFLYLFLPLTLLVYFLVPGLRLKNIVLLAASLLFYAMGQPVYVLLLVGLSYANFAMARRIRPGKRNTLLLPVVVNLAVLGLFKYLDFFLGIFGITVADGGVMLAALRGITNGLNSIGFAFRSPTSALPLGLSFYAFQVISYVADVYRGKVKAERSFFNLLLYLSMFPKMMQGPIVRYEQVARQLMDRRTTPRAAFEGAALYHWPSQEGPACRLCGQGRCVAEHRRWKRHVRRRMARCADVHVPDLFRFLRLFRYGHWPWPHLRLPLLREL